MPNAHNVDAKIDALLDVAAQSLKVESAAGYHQFQAEVSALEGLARETFQAKLDEMYWPILQKLEDGQPLTTAERDILELLMVGEAKYYLKTETSVETWRAELNRLIEDIKKQQAAGLDEIDSLMRLRALCREALRILPDLAFYFGELERVRRFDEATRGAIDADTRRALANLIKEMMESDEL